MTNIAVLPGDGIGPEVTETALRVLQAAGFTGTLTTHPVGWSQWVAKGEALPAATLKAARSADAVFFGAITSKPDDLAQAELPPKLQGRVKYRSPIIRLRTELDLYANFRPCQGNDLDLVVFRENTEGLYSGFEQAKVSPTIVQEFPGLPADAAISLRVVTPKGARRICDAAFRYADEHGRERVTLLEKANVLRETGGLVRKMFYEAAKKFPAITPDELHIDAACARVISHPTDFDVVVATNLFGDIFSDIAAELSGGLPLAASANYGSKHALFEPVHGSAPAIAGQGIANPFGAVKAAALMARHLKQGAVAERLDAAVVRVIGTGKVLPDDMGGTAKTSEIEAALIAAL